MPRASSPARRLLAWYGAEGRELPWRRTRDPYAVWVSEVMLQQTRVATARPYWERFLRAYPSVEALAAAEEDEVLRLWSGLGYYRRARFLHRAAQEIARSGWPRTREGLAALPGFGPYTSAAVAAIAFDEPVLAVDGNVRRVARRFFGERDEDRATRLAAETLFDRTRPGDATQALFDLGATVCTPRAPRCAACPLARGCRGREAPEALDPPSRRARPEATEVTALLARRGRRVLLVRREGGLLGGTWTLPFAEGGAAAVEAAFGARAGARIAEVEHVFTHRRWRLSVHAARSVPRGGAWRRPDEVAISTVFRKALEASGVAMESLSDAPLRGAR